LEFQIVENVLTVALAVLREPAEAKQQALRLFPQHLLRRPRKTKKEEAEGQDLVAQGAAAAAGNREPASTWTAAPSERSTSDQPTAESPVTAEVENTLPG